MVYLVAALASVSVSTACALFLRPAFNAVREGDITLERFTVTARIAYGLATVATALAMVSLLAVACGEW